MGKLANFLQLELGLRSGLRVALALAILHALGAAVRVRVRRKGTRRPERSRPLPLSPFLVPPWRLVPLLGFAFTTVPSPARAQSIGPPKSERWVAPPWTRTSGHPPPRPLVRSWAPPDMPEDPGRISRTLVSDNPVSSIHPAIHGRAFQPRGRLVPLFPRAGHVSPDATARIGGGEETELPGPPMDEEVRRAMAESIRRHPSGREAPASSSPSQATPAHRCAWRGERSYTVRTGDTLWSIAEQTLPDDDPRFVARYWPKIHRANRDVIGPDPSLIYPGQVLHLPPCED